MALGLGFSRRCRQARGIVAPQPNRYIASQSSVLLGRVATYALLTDGDLHYGCLTDYGNSWIQATFPAPVTVQAISVGGGSDPSAGSIALTGDQLQYSLNNADWVILTTITGNYAQNYTPFKFTLPAPITTAYWRVFNREYVWISELTFDLIG